MNTHKVPFVDIETLEAKGTHFTTREQRKSGRPIVHYPVADFKLDRFSERYLPVRGSANYRERKNKIGHLWMSKTRSLLPFESLLEQSILLDLDRDSTVARVWSQPFRVEGFDPNRGNRRVYPTPDLFIERVDGSLEVIEVKPQRQLDKPKAASFQDEPAKYAKAVKNWERLHASLTFQGSVFSSLGWGFSTRSELSPIRRRNLEYLSPYRRPLVKGDALATEVLQNASTKECCLIDLAESSGGFVAAMPVILHLVWWRELELDINEPLNEYSLVSLPTVTTPVLEVAA